MECLISAIFNSPDVSAEFSPLPRGRTALGRAEEQCSNLNVFQPPTSETASGQLRCHHFVIRELNFSSVQLRPIRRLEPFHRVRPAMRLLRRLILKNEEVHKACRILLPLPREVQLRARLARLDMGNELRDGALHLL